MSLPILIVDDNPMNLKLARVVLQSAGYDVRTAMNAEETMRVIGEARPRLILMDLQLPDIDGFELTRRIRANPSLSGIIVLALTAYAMKGDEERAYAAGCDGYIAKPIDTRTFAATIARWLDT
ncbi:MAG TPA: response regulator [Herpetosiphonaceae bacterium]